MVGRAWLQDDSVGGVLIGVAPDAPAHRPRGDVIGKKVKASRRPAIATTSSSRARKSAANRARFLDLRNRMPRFMARFCTPRSRRLPKFRDHGGVRAWSCRSRQWKSRSPLRPPIGGAPLPSFGRKRFIEAHASISVPSTEKCSDDSNGVTRGLAGQPRQPRVRQVGDRPQPMIPRHQGLGASVAEQLRRLAIPSAHRAPCPQRALA